MHSTKTLGSSALDGVLRHIRTFKTSLDEVATGTGFSTELHVTIIPAMLHTHSFMSAGALLS
jgi:hypothetical protein